MDVRDTRNFGSALRYLEFSQGSIRFYPRIQNGVGKFSFPWQEVSRRGPLSRESPEEFAPGRENLFVRSRSAAEMYGFTLD